MTFYYLEMTQGSVVGQRYLLADGAVSVGRSSQNTITLPPAEKSVSGHHLIIYKSPERIMVQDMQSTNGTFVNEQKIAEQDLKEGDILGFGQTGPRLKLVVSETELDTSPPASSGNSFDDMTSIKTHEEPIPMLASKDATSNEDEDTIYKLKNNCDEWESPTEKSSVTVELEKKLINRSVDSEDMNKLLKQGERLEKILARGNLGETQAQMLRSAYKANKSIDRKSVV